MFLFLAGPVIWYASFWLMYLIAETACTQDGLRFRALGLPGVSVVTAGLSLLAVLAMAGLAFIAYRRRAGPVMSDDREETGPAREGADRHLLYWGGAVLGALFALAVLMVGIPAVVLTPC